MLILTAIFIAGCSAGNQSTGNSFMPSGTATGGVSKPADNINLKDISITADNEATTITLSLLSGSRKAGYNESKLTELPEYQITQLTEPQRIMIKLNNISFWDYTPKAEWALSDFVLGVFKEIPANEDTLIIYIQLSMESNFIVSEDEGDLIIKLSPYKVNEGVKYYCVSDSFYEHQEGAWPDNINMYPVLCSDMTNKLIISQPFETKEDADSFMDDAILKLGSTTIKDSLYIIKLAGGSLPDYSGNGGSTEADGKSVIMKAGILADTPALVQNGKYLATASDGKIAFSRLFKPEDNSLMNEGYALSESLWTIDTNGRVEKPGIPDQYNNFYNIQSASFSPNGRYLALLDVSIENSVLYVCDFETEELINLGEEGLGSEVSSFDWDDTHNILYVLSGNNTLSIKKCIFQTDGSFEIDQVEETKGTAGTLDISGGKLFFSVTDVNSGIIYEVGETKLKITEGVDFTISADGKKMLVSEISSTGEQDLLTNLKLYDIETEETVYIVKDKEICDFCFSQNGSKVYYTGMQPDGATEEYKYGLFSFDIASGTEELTALSSTCVFSASTTPGTLYFIYYFDKSFDSFYATFKYEINK